MKHTKEPWKFQKGFNNVYAVVDCFTTHITKTNSSQVDNGFAEAEANAKRIVACVNACADVEDDCLEQGYVKWLQQRIVELELSVMNLEEEIARLKVIDNRLVTNGDWEDV